MISVPCFPTSFLMVAVSISISFKILNYRHYVGTFCCIFLKKGLTGAQQHIFAPGPYACSSKCEFCVFFVYHYFSMLFNTIGVDVWGWLSSSGLSKQQTVTKQLWAAAGVSTNDRGAPGRWQPGILGHWVPALWLEQPIAWPQPFPGQQQSTAPTARPKQSVPRGGHVQGPTRTGASAGGEWRPHGWAPVPPWNNSICPTRVVLPWL